MIHQPYKVVVFDWEGTIAEDLVGQVLQAIAEQAHHLRLGSFDRYKARHDIGLGLPRALHKLFPALNMHQQQDLLQHVHHALSNSALHVCLMPHVARVIEILYERGVQLGIATNKGQASLLRILHASGLENFFAAVRCAGQLRPKPCPDMLQDILDELNASPQETLMIGDSLADIEMARSLGVDAIGFDSYGEQVVSLRAAGALDVFQNYQQVAAFLHLGI